MKTGNRAEFVEQKLKTNGEEANADSEALAESSRSHAEDAEESSPKAQMEHDIDREAMSADDLEEIEGLVGRNLDDRYLIAEELARGGMGIVFRAEHLTLNRQVVIKVLKASQIESSSARQRFEREARRACQLDHPNIVTVHDFGYYGDLGYLVMEFVDGITLHDYVREYGPLTFAQFAPVASAILSGLAEAHRLGIVHRDIKASNIMLTFNEDHLHRVKILDFGLAKAEGVEEDNVTRQSALVGTMGAMPPERILCKPTDCRVDLYALGICCYRMISGRRPFVGEDMHVLYQHVHEHPPPLTERLPAGHEYPLVVLEWVHRLLAKEPDDRPRDGAQAREWLLETVAEKSVFRLDEVTVAWKQRTGTAQFGNLTGTFEAADPSWSITGSPSGSYRSLIKADSANRIVSEIRAQEEEREHAEKTRTTKMVAVAGIGVVLGVVGVVSLLANKSPDPVDTTATNGQATAVKAKPEPTKPAPSTNIDAVFAEIENNLEKGAYATAENLLTSIAGAAASSAKHQVKVAEFQSRIDIDKNLRRARQAEGDLSIESAIKAYDAVLSLDANNAEAKERHNELSARVVLKVSSDPAGGGVYVDGTRVGATPLEKMIDFNFSKVEVKMPHYVTWSASLVPKGGTSVELVADMVKRVRRGSEKEPTPKPTKGIRNEDLMGME